MNDPSELPQAPATAAADEADGLIEAVLVPPKGLVPTLLLVLLAVAAWAILMPARFHPEIKAQLQLTSWQEGAQHIAQTREKELVAVPPDPAESRLAGDFAVWLAREATVGLAKLSDQPEARRALGDLEERMRAFGLRVGRAGVAAAAMRWAKRVRLAYEADLRAAGQGVAGQRGALDRIAPGLRRTLNVAGVAAWRQANGHLLPAAALVVEAIAELRYLGLARRMPAPRPELGSRLAILLLRYRVEAHRGLELRRRLKLAEQLSRLDPAWPSTWATAVLMARDGRYRAARAWFLQAAAKGEHAEAARQNARWCRQQLRLGASARRHVGAVGR